MTDGHFQGSQKLGAAGGAEARLVQEVLTVLGLGSGVMGRGAVRSRGNWVLVPWLPQGPELHPARR